MFFRKNKFVKKLENLKDKEGSILCKVYTDAWKSWLTTYGVSGDDLDDAIDEVSHAVYDGLIRTTDKRKKLEASIVDLLTEMHSKLDSNYKKLHDLEWEFDDHRSYYSDK